MASLVVLDSPGGVATYPASDIELQAHEFTQRTLRDAACNSAIHGNLFSVDLRDTNNGRFPSTYVGYVLAVAEEEKLLRVCLPSFCREPLCLPLPLMSSIVLDNFRLIGDLQECGMLVQEAQRFRSLQRAQDVKVLSLEMEIQRSRRQVRDLSEEVMALSRRLAAVSAVSDVTNSNKCIFTDAPFNKFDPATWFVPRTGDYDCNLMVLSRELDKLLLTSPSSESSWDRYDAERQVHLMKRYLAMKNHLLIGSKTGAECMHRFEALLMQHFEIIGRPLSERRSLTSFTVNGGLDERHPAVEKMIRYHGERARCKNEVTAQS